MLYDVIQRVKPVQSVYNKMFLTCCDKMLLSVMKCYLATKVFFVYYVVYNLKKIKHIKINVCLIFSLFWIIYETAGWIDFNGTSSDR